MKQKQKRIKIAHVTFDMRIGGTEQVIMQLVENTNKNRYDVSIICIDSHIGPFGRMLQNKGFKFQVLDRKSGFDFSLIMKIYKYIVLNHIDVLHCHQYTPYVYGVLSAGLTSTKVIFTEHGRFFPDIRKPKRIIINPFLNIFTDHITAISDATRTALAEIENFPKNKIQLIYNGIIEPPINIPQQTIQLKEKLRIQEKANVIGTVARLDVIKNQKMMIRALKKVHENFPTTYLLVVGDGPEKYNLEKYAKQYGLSSHVIFTGFREDAFLFYQIMDIFLLTSFSEGTAMTLLEAMASSVPCIATNVGGNPEIVIDEKTGFIIPNDNDHVLSERICLLLSKKSLLQEMGEAGRSRFENTFSVNQMAQAYEKLYNQ